MSEAFDDRFGKVRRDHPDTSYKAAAEILPRTGTQRRAVYDAIAKYSSVGLTDLELQRLLRLGGNSERPRRVELVESELIVDSGQRRKGHIVWVLKPEEER